MTEYFIDIDLHQFANGEDTRQQELNFGHPQYIENVVVIQPNRKDFISLFIINNTWYFWCSMAAI